MNLLGDFGAGAMSLVTGVLAALWEREQSGVGQVVDTAIVDATITLSAMIFGYRASGFWTDERGTNILDTGAPFYDVYETADGQWMAVGPIEAKFYAEFLRLLELPDAPDRDDVANWPELRRIFADRFASADRAHWAAVFDGTDACVEPVLTYAEAAHHPQVVARAAIIERDGIQQPAPSPRFSRTQPALGRRTPVAGEHSAEILRDWQADGADALLTGGAVHQSG
jgi:alpha-methylacyl-CoA racemase